MQDQPAPPAPPPRCTPRQSASAVQGCHAFLATDLRVVSGANLGDPLGPPEDMVPGDAYMLAPDAKPTMLALRRDHEGQGQAIAGETLLAAGTETGTPGDRVRICSQLTLMAPDGDPLDVLVLRLTPAGDTAHDDLPTTRGTRHLAVPLSAIAARTEYTLLRIAPPPLSAQLADLVCLSFLRGTRISLSSGDQLPIEALKPGDRILTRDHGPQALRWVGRTTLRARGPFAPVVIPAGVLGNLGDLAVGPHHRLFVYLRNRPEAVATAELLVQARHLVDMRGIFRREGGFADYHSLVFDRHEIIYAEGIPVESLMVHEATVSGLPADLADALRRTFPDLSQDQHFGTEATGSLIRALLADGWLGGKRS